MTQIYPTAREIGDALESWADPRYAESYDNIGLLVGRRDREVQCALIALDLTPAVIQEADRLGAGMILTHHPLLFKPTQRILADDLQGQMILQLARLDITLFSIHTNLDSVTGGVSFDLARRFGLVDISFLSPQEDATYGLGALGRLKEPLTLEAFLHKIARTLDTSTLRYTGISQASVSTVALCGGACSNLVSTALSSGADAYVTSDIPYYRFFEVLDPNGHPRMALIDAGHYETECHTEALLCDWLGRHFPKVSFVRTELRTSPIQTYVR